MHANPGLSSWAKFSKFSRPSGTEFGNGVLAHALKPSLFAAFTARLKSCPDTKHLELICQVEDSDLNQFADGQVFKASGLHTLDEGGRDVENAHLDQLVQRGLVAQGTDLFYLVCIDAVHTQSY